MKRMMILGFVFVCACAAFAQQDQQQQTPKAPLSVCGKSRPEPCAKTPPQPISTPDPEYSEEARKKKKQGTIVLLFVVGTDGIPYDIRPENHLGYGLDEEAIATLKKWRFTPGKTADGTVVPVTVEVTMSFKLY